MDKVIQALDEGKSALLESPTGTGKTLCLLCATISWVKQRGPQLVPAATLNPDGSEVDSNKEKLNASVKTIPKLYYSSRTHSQLKQVIKELKATGYEISSTVLGSRDQLCVNKAVNKFRGAQLNALCRQHVKAKACRFYNSGKFDKTINVSGQDIEDLYRSGSDLEHPFCPYYKVSEREFKTQSLFRNGKLYDE